MLRVLLLAAALTARLASLAVAADAHWLCYAGAKTTKTPASLCWPAGAGDDAVPAGAPLAGWGGARTREAPRTIEVVNRLGRASVRVKGSARRMLVPAGGGTAVLTCRPARARAAPGQGARLVLHDAHGEHVVALGRPQRLCEPADAALPQLLCYGAGARGAKPAAAALMVATGRGALRVRPGAVRELCVPTLRPATEPPSQPPDEPQAPSDPGDPPPGSPAPPQPPPSDPGEPTIPPPPPVEPPAAPGVVLQIHPTTLTVVAGERPAFTATAFFEAGGSADWTARVLWVSSDETVAVVGGSPGSAGGAFVEAAGPGTATIAAIDPETGATSSPGGDATLTVVWPLEKITLTPHAVILKPGGQESFTATGHFTGGFTRNLTQRVTYASSAPAVASAPNAAGNRSRVHALAPGMATISATDPLSGISTAQSGNDASVRVAGALFAISITTQGDGGYPVALRPGESHNFTAVGHYQDGTTRNLTQHCEWSSGDPAIAVYALGSTFTGVAPGGTWVTCREPGTGIAASTTLDVVGALVRLDVYGAWPPVRPGKPRSLTAIGVYEPFADSCCRGRRNLTQEVTWASRDPEIALATNEAGNRSRIVAVGQGGTARIFASDPQSGVTSGDLALPVFGAITAVEIERCGFQSKMPVGSTQSPCKIRAVFDGGAFDMRRFAGDEWVFESSDPGVAEVLPDGHQIHGMAPGFFTLTVRHVPSGVVSNPVPYTVQGDLVRILLDPLTVRRAIGESDSLSARGEYAPGGITELLTQRLVYSSSDESVIVMSNTPGNRSRFITVGAGTVTVTATDPVSGLSATATVEVLPGTIERITIAPATLVLATGLSRELTATGHYADGHTINVTQQVTWTSLDPAIAETPNPSGGRSRVDGLSPGTARIVARHPTGASSHDTGDDAVVTVQAITGVSLTPENRSGRAGTTVRYTLVGTLTDGSTVNLTQRAGYSVYDTSIALPLNDDGDRSAIRLLTPGTVTVQAYAFGGDLIDFVLGTRTDTATLTVTE